MKIVAIIGSFIFSTLLYSSEKIQSNDPLFSKQWALENKGQVVLQFISDLERERIQGTPGADINWIETSTTETSKKDLIVAVLDSGVDINHPDLSGRIWYNDKLCTNAPNAKNLPCNGYNFLEGNPNVSDDVGHGTHVAGIIAANRNAMGIMGAADPRIKIMPLKVLNAQVNGFVYNGKLITDVIADALIFAIKNGAEVVNLSLGWPKLIDTPKVREAFKLAEEKNVFIVAASGNNSKDLPTFPCSYENVVCVGAHDNRGELSSFSNYGSKVDLVAPGEYIISTIPKNLESRALRIAHYDAKRGSSQGAPFVTAAVATLKLLNPDILNDKVRSLLFRSSKNLTENKNNRFVKFGALDMGKLLSLAKIEETNAFLNPLLKGITEIKYKAFDRRFSFTLPFKNLSDTEYTGTVCLSEVPHSLALDQRCFEVQSLGAHAVIAFEVTGQLLNLENDSHIEISISVDQKTFYSSLVFSRDLNEDGDLVSETIEGGNFDDMAFINGERKLSRMTRVMDKHHQLHYPEYFFLEKAKQSPTNSVVSLLTKEKETFTVKTFSLPVVNRVLSIHRKDINLDGKLDYFIYTLSAKKDELLFFCFDQNLNFLFKQYSSWAMPLSTFEGLPIDGGIEKFEWIKIISPQLGAIVVPSIYKSYLMPESDNSKKILDRMTYQGHHQFYLNPVLLAGEDRMKIELRVLDSVSAMKKMRKDFHLYEDQRLTLLSPFPQTSILSNKGEIHSLASIDDGELKTYIEVVFDGHKITSKPLTDLLGMDSSLIYPLVNRSTGQIMNEAILTSLLNRSSAEFLIKGKSEVSRSLVLKKDWENPIIGLLAAVGSENEIGLIVENRSSVSYISTQGAQFDLPVYRDSSFPGQNFSESLQPILSDGQVGLFINSTLIYGDRLYSMIASNEQFIRPLRLSVDIPLGCVPLNPEVLEDKKSSNYVFLCADKNKRPTLKFLPMSEH